MRTVLFVTIAVAFAAGSAVAQDQTGQSSEMSELPKACQQALHGMDMSKSSMQSPMPMQGMNGMGDMDEAQKASMDAMMKMMRQMMAAHMIKDPDLSFNCGMAVHHQGAIDMAEIELKYGKDKPSRTMAEDIIKAQKKEIREMSDRAEKLLTK